MPQIIEYKSEEEWLDHRRKSVTSSDVAALFNESPYVTEYELYHRKKDGLIVSFDENDRMKWGKRLENPIAEGLAEDNGWVVNPLKVFMVHSSCPRYGSSFDFEIRRGNEKGLFELKNVDFKEYKEKWLVNGDQVEAPIHIELQLQSELEVANSENQEPYTFGIIGALIGGNKPIVIERSVDKEIGKLIVKKINNFWYNVENNIEPLPDFQRDMDVIKLLYADTYGEEIDLSNSNRFPELLKMYDIAHASEVDGKKHKEAIKAEMITLMGKAGIAKCNGTYVTRKSVTRKSYTVAESNYIDMRIKKAKE